MTREREYTITQLLDAPEIQLLMRRDQVEREDVVHMMRKLKLSRRWRGNAQLDEESGSNHADVIFEKSAPNPPAADQLRSCLAL